MFRKFATIAGTIGTVVGILLLGVAITSLMGAARPEFERQEAEPRLPAAFYEEAAYEPVQLTVFAQGEVRPRREIALTTQVSGRITDVSDDFVDGGSISEGDVLVRLESADYESALTRARARVASARQALQLAEAEAELAARDYRELTGNRGDASALTLRQPQLAGARAEYEAAQADLADAELAVRRTRITAPFDGRVREIAADIGQFVPAGAQLGRVFNTDAVEVRLPLTDADFARLNLPFAYEAEPGEGPEVTLTARAAGKERRWTGHVVRTDAAIDPRTRQIAAIVRVLDPYGAGADKRDAPEGTAGFPLAIGLFVSAEIEGPVIERAVTLPRLAVQEEEGRAVVYTLLDDDTVERTEVSVAATTPAGVIITDGLEPGQRVLVSRLPTAVGKAVRPLRPGEDPEPPAPAEEADEGEGEGEGDDASEARSGGSGGRSGGAGR